MNLKQMILRQQELLDTAKAEKRELTAEEQAEFDELTKSIQAAQAAPTTPTPESNSDDVQDVSLSMLFAETSRFLRMSARLSLMAERLWMRLELPLLRSFREITLL